MKSLFLTSSIGAVNKDLVKHFSYSISGQKMAFIDTASELEEIEKGGRPWIQKDLDSMKSLGFDVFRYTLTEKTPTQLVSDLSDVDVLYVGGGNTYYLLQQVQLSGFTEIAKKHVEQGKVYIGTSAGSIIAGPDIELAYRPDGPVNAPKLKGTQSLGLVDFTVLPHWGSDMAKELYLHHRIEHDYIPTHKIILLSDTQYVIVKEDWYKIVDVNSVSSLI